MSPPSPSSSPTFLLHTSLRYDPLLPLVHHNPALAHAQTSHNYNHPSPFYLLPFHRDRLLRAATHFSWPTAIHLLTGPQGLETLSEFITTELSKSQPQPSAGPLRLRITISRTGSLTLTAFPYPPLPLEALFPSSLSLSPPSETASVYTITLDSTKTAPSKYTHFKTTHRDMYDAARQRAHIEIRSAKQEVLLVNEADGSIMEGSITTPYFFRNGRWVTPPVKARYESGADSGGNDGTSRRWALESSLASEEVILADSLVDGEVCWLSNGASGFFFGRIKLY